MANKFFINKECGNVFEFNAYGKLEMYKECYALYGDYDISRHYDVIEVESNESLVTDDDGNAITSEQAVRIMDAYADMYGYPKGWI